MPHYPTSGLPEPVETEWQLSWDVCAQACDDLDLALPYPLREHRVLAQQAATDPDGWRRRTRQEARPWCSADGRWEESLAAALRVLCRSPRAVTAVGWLGDGDSDGSRNNDLAARVGIDGELAVRATAENWGLDIDRVRPAAWVRAVVSLIPASKPGTMTGSPSFPAPGPENGATGDAGGLLTPVHAPRTSTAKRIELARTITAVPHHRAGGLTAHARGERDTSSRTLGWFDTDTGRYAVLTTSAADGVEWINYFPADNDTLTHRLTELLNDLP